MPFNHRSFVEVSQNGTGCLESATNLVNVKVFEKYF